MQVISSPTGSEWQRYELDGAEMRSIRIQSGGPSADSHAFFFLNASQATIQVSVQLH